MRTKMRALTIDDILMGQWEAESKLFFSNDKSQQMVTTDDSVSDELELEFRNK